jgi:hypothetical protein
MPTYSRYFVAETYFSTQPSYNPVTGTTCYWGHCWYSVGAYWGYTEYRRITLRLTGAAGPIRHISMFGWTGTLPPGATLNTTEYFLSLGSTPTVGAHATADFPVGTDGFSIEFDADNTSFPIEVQLDYDLVPGDADYCQYGSQIRSDVPSIVLLAPNILLLIVSGATDGWGWAIAQFFAGEYLNVDALCASIRPTPPSFTWQEILSLSLIPGTAPSAVTLGKAVQWLHWAAWGVYCQCVAGSPAPVEPPLLPEPKPVGAPPGPLVGFVCDDTTLCRQIEELTLGITALSQRVASTFGLVTLIQRQDVPFGYVAGTIHSALSGFGDFPVQGIIGLACTFDTLPAIYVPTAGDPDTYHQLGKLTLGTVDGWERSFQPTHSPYLILPISGAVTKVGYSFAGGIVATLTELVREP